MTDKTLLPRVQEKLVLELIHRHPLPWRIEHDWTVEVTDAKDRIVIKVMTDDEAMNLINFADAVATQHAQTSREVAEMLKGSA